MRPGVQLSSFKFSNLLLLAQGGGLKSRLFRGLAWTTVGFAGAQIMRLGSNLLMTRLLAPEHFGVMAIVTVVLIGLAMFSDIGLGPGVIRSPKIHDEGFLNTAWTMQLARGGLLQVACCLFAWPAANFYSEPRLSYLLPVAGISLFISALAPMQIYTLQRNMVIGALTSIELAAQACAFVVMVTAGYFYKSIWVLVLGALVASSVKTAAQWLVLPGHKHRLAFVREDVRDLFRFGGWIFLSTILAFASNSAGSLILGKISSMEKVGLFSIAATLAKASEQFYDQISNRVLFPIYAAFSFENTPGLRRKLFKIRLGIILGFVPGMCAVAFFANPLFAIMFDNRYTKAAWIFQLILLGLVPSVIASTLPYLIAQGKSRLGTFVSAIKLFGYILFIYFGFHFNGEDGAIVGMACLPALMYAVDYGLQRRYGLSDFRLDALALSFLMTTVVLIKL